MTTISHHANALRNVAADLEKLTHDGSLDAENGAEVRVKAFDRIANASRIVFGSADFFDGLLVGLAASGIINEDDK